MMCFIALMAANLYGLIEINWRIKFILLSMLERPTHLFEHNFSQRVDGVGVPELYESEGVLAVVATPVAGNRVL